MDQSLKFDCNTKGHRVKAGGGGGHKGIIPISPSICFNKKILTKQQQQANLGVMTLTVVLHLYL